MKYVITFNTLDKYEKTHFKIIESDNFYETDRHIVFFDYDMINGLKINRFLYNMVDIKYIRPFVNNNN